MIICRNKYFEFYTLEKRSLYSAIKSSKTTDFDEKYGGYMFNKFYSEYVKKLN